MVLKVCIIGAGTSGLCCLRELIEENERHSSEGPLFDFHIYEKFKDVGGIWQFADACETIGGPGFLYKNLRTNTPKAAWNFRDCPVPEKVPNWLSPCHVNEQIIQFVEKFQLRQFIQTNTEVDLVSKVIGGVNKYPQWKVKVQDKKSGKMREDIYDYVIVCSGISNIVDLPTFPGQDEFNGSIIHSSDYRIPNVYKDKRVLLVGQAVSMWEISHDLRNYAKEILVSAEDSPVLRLIRPENNSITHDVASLESFRGSFAVLSDGIEIEVDDVILCTGYKGRSEFPFLHESCNVGKRYNHLYPAYKNMFHPDHPSLIFLGLWDMTGHIPLVEVMATFISKVLIGKVPLPDKDEMYREIETDYENFLKSGMPGKYYHLLGPREKEYANWLCKKGDFTVPLYPFVLIEHVLQQFMAKRYHKMKEENYIKIDDETFKVI